VRIYSFVKNLLRCEVAVLNKLFDSDAETGRCYRPRFMLQNYRRSDLLVYTNDRIISVIIVWSKRMQ